MTAVLLGNQAPHESETGLYHSHKVGSQVEHHHSYGDAAGGGRRMAHAKDVARTRDLHPAMSSLTTVSLPEGWDVDESAITLEHLWPQHSSAEPGFVVAEDPDVQRAIEEILGARPSNIGPDDATMLLTNVGQDHFSYGPAAVSALPPTRATTTAYVAGQLVRTNNAAGAGYYFLCTTAGTSSGTATGSLTWNTTPGATTTDGGVTWTSIGPAPAYYIGLTANATPPAGTDTTLTAEITTGGGGLIRAAAAFAHTVAAATYTLTKAFTANGSDALPVTLAKAANFNELLQAVGGLMPFETLFSTTATLAASGDASTLTWTITV